MKDFDPDRQRPRRIKQLAVAGVAVAAVAGVAIVGSAAARTGRPAAETPDAAALPAAGGYEVQGKVDPSTIKPTEPPLAKDSVAACKTPLASSDEPKPGRNAKVVARFDGTPGSVLVLADGKYWAGCDTAYSRHDGQGSLRRPAKLRQPAAFDADAFFVANNLIPVMGKTYEYYWAAGMMPAGVAKINYTFPDGVTADAVVQGNYWVMQHEEAAPWREGSGADRAQIKVKLIRANGSVIDTIALTWGTQTCAQISHGC